MIDGPRKTIFHFKSGRRKKEMGVKIAQLAEIMENT